MKTLGSLSGKVSQEQVKRRGIFFALAIVCLFGVLTFVGMSVDLGMITVTKTRMQSAADAACLAAAQEIVVAVREAGQNGVTDPTEVQAYSVAQARNMAEHVVELNGFWIDKAVDVEFGSRLLAADGETYVETWGSAPYNMVRVKIRKDNDDATAGDAKLPLIFAPVVGQRKQKITSSAVSFIESRDLVAVLDYSGSMAYDSLIYTGTIDRIGIDEVTGSLDSIWNSLVAANVTFSDDSSTVKFPSDGFGEIDSYEGIYLSSNTVDTVYEQLDLDGAPEETFNYWDDWSQQSNGSFRKNQDGWRWRKWPTGNLERRPMSGGSWTVVPDSTFPGYFETYTVGAIPPYPFPQEGKSGGNLNGKPSNSTSESMWKDYIEYVMDNSTLDSYGYEKKYGYRTLMHYLISQRMMNHQSEDLWRAPIYPHHAMKQGVTMFTQFLDNLSYGDHVGLVTYATTSQRQIGLWDDGVEITVDLGDEHLTDDYAAINNIQTHKQPGHYNRATGTGYGIEDARELLEEQGRYGAQPHMVLMTDGQPNQYPSGFGMGSLPSGWDWNDMTDFDGDGVADFEIDSSYGGWDSNWQAALYAFLKAKECKDAGIVIHTMSVGSGADQDLMEAIAKMTGGNYLHVDGGSTLEEMEDQLQTAFAIMAGRVPPARLVQDGE